LSPLEAFLEIYRAQCSYFGKIPSMQLGYYLENLSSKLQQKDMDLTECPNMEPDLEDVIDFVPVMNTLKFDTYFRGFSIRDIQVTLKKKPTTKPKDFLNFFLLLFFFFFFFFLLHFLLEERNC
jgi:hypothetical protein